MTRLAEEGSWGTEQGGRTHRPHGTHDTRHTGDTNSPLSKRRHAYRSFESAAKVSSSFFGGLETESAWIVLLTQRDRAMLLVWDDAKQKMEVLLYYFVKGCAEISLFVDIKGEVTGHCCESK